MQTFDRLTCVERELVFRFLADTPWTIHDCPYYESGDKRVYAPVNPTILKTKYKAPIENQSELLNWIHSASGAGFHVYGMKYYLPDLCEMIRER